MTNDEGRRLFSGTLPRNSAPTILSAAEAVTPAQLAASIEQWARREVDSVTITVGGAFLMYVPGAPDWVNAGFPSSLEQGTPFILRLASEEQP